MHQRRQSGLLRQDSCFHRCLRHRHQRQSGSSHFFVQRALSAALLVAVLFVSRLEDNCYWSWCLGLVKRGSLVHDFDPLLHFKKEGVPMDSINPECTEFKKAYEACFNKWYSQEFLKGNATKNPCGDLFREYQVCLIVCPLPSPRPSPKFFI